MALRDFCEVISGFLIMNFYLSNKDFLFPDAPVYRLTCQAMYSNKDKF